jgi:carbonic anhydrase/acetyltransferase-like protein (isoleucine patch superfamily)
MLYAFEGRQPSMGEGTYVSETATVIGNVRTGKNCYIGHGAIIRADYGAVEIGDGTAIEEGVIIHAPPGGLCRIGAHVIVGHGAIVHAASIGESCAIGMGAVISLEAEVGAGAIVAEGAVVVQGRKIPPSVVVAGSPARRLRDVRQAEREFWEDAVKLYMGLAETYLKGAMRRIDPP